MNAEERDEYDKKMAEQAEAHKHAAAQNKRIMEEHRKLKHLMATQKFSGKSHIGKKKRGMRSKNKKTQFWAGRWTENQFFDTRYITVQYLNLN